MRDRIKLLKRLYLKSCTSARNKKQYLAVVHWTKREIARYENK